MDVGVRDAIVPVAAGQSLFAAAREIGAASLEILVERDFRLPHLVLEDGSAPFSVADAAGRAAVRQRLEAEELRAGALFVATDFSGDDADEQLVWAAEVARAANDLGAPAVRIDTWTRRADLPVAAIRDNFARRIRTVLEQTSDTGVDLGIENHGTISNDPEFLDAIFNEVGDPRLGMTLDTGNFYWYGFPLRALYAILTRFAPRARHTHVKNIAYPPELIETQRPKGFEYGRYAAPLDEGNIAMDRVVSILRGAGYDRDLCVENEALGRYAPGERLAILRRDVQALRNALEETSPNG